MIRYFTYLRIDRGMALTAIDRPVEPPHADESEGCCGGDLDWGNGEVGVCLFPLYISISLLIRRRDVVLT